MSSLFQALGKVIAIRLKHPFKNQGRTQHSESTTANSEGDSSISTDLSNLVPAPMLSSNLSPVHPVSASSKPGLDEFSTGFPSTVYPWGASPAREASDIAQVALPSVQAFMGVFPLVGAPMQAAIGGLLGILQVIDRYDQNKVALDDLTSRLYQLCCHLCNAPPALDPLEHSRRDSLARKLQDTSARLRKLQKRRLAYTSTTQAITQCSTDIDRYLIAYLVSSQMQSLHEIRELHIILRGPQEIEQSFAVPSASHLAGTVTLVDATGFPHRLSVDYCNSFQQLNMMLQVLLCNCDPIAAQIQRRYLEAGQYDLCIDEGTQVTPLTSDKWSSIERGTKIVMRVIIQQETVSGSEVDYRCHFCGALNRLGVTSVKYVIRGRTVCSTDCRKCKRRFQITRGRMKQLTQSSNSNFNHTNDAETLRIRNFHVQQISELFKFKEWSEELSEELLSEFQQLLLESEKQEKSEELQKQQSLLEKEKQKFESSSFWLKLLLQQEEFLRRVCETPVVYLRPGLVPPSHDTSSSIEEIESDINQDEEGDETEEDSDDAPW